MTVPVSAASALRRRRRATEITGIAVAGVSLVATMLVWPLRPYLPPVWLENASATLAIFGPLTLVTLVLGLLAFRGVGTSWYRAAAGARLAVEVLTCLAAVLVVPVPSRAAAYCLLVLPVLMTGVRFARIGALLTWAGGLTGFGAIALALVRHEPAGVAAPASQAALTGLLFAVIIGGLAAWTVGSQALAVDRHLAALDAAHAALQHQATHDALTGLANRSVLYGPAIAQRQPGALLAIDLDGFKAVNDTHGHAAGDAVLRAVADRLRACAGPDDLVVRMGGDEFVIALAATSDPDVVAERIRAAIGLPVQTGAGPLRVGASVGMARTSGPWDVDALAAEADARMYAEKAAHRVGR
ncbi:GGDEF domain-containing protein [Cryptosporangium sp. NPDC051539]|uniref:GGDEF domain-containing protein n=1 Tax=Cryptosporangium sp. NPDC051539 TaxID=3363962 RepID=UPI0037971EEA